MGIGGAGSSCWLVRVGVGVGGVGSGGSVGGGREVGIVGGAVLLGVVATGVVLGAGWGGMENGWADTAMVGGGGCKEEAVSCCRKGSWMNKLGSGSGVVERGSCRLREGVDGLGFQPNGM